MKRREFITLLGGAVAWPLTARGQPAAPVVGLLRNTPSASFEHIVAALRRGLIEAGWVRLRELELELPGLPPELDGLRIVHLSDFHFGVPSPGVGATWRAAVWARERRPDFVAITGDLLTHPRGEPMLRRLVRLLPSPTVAVLGNHDVAISRDPQARRSDLQELEPATLLSDEGRLIELRGRSVWIAGADPRFIEEIGPCPRFLKPPPSPRLRNRSAQYGRVPAVEETQPENCRARRRHRG